jgi:hypothetical protein
MACGDAFEYNTEHHGREEVIQLWDMNIYTITIKHSNFVLASLIIKE